LAKEGIAINSTETYYDFVVSAVAVRISAYTNQSRVSHSVRMRENSAEEYPKQSSLERSF